jgi:hypothetical protein
LCAHTTRHRLLRLLPSAHHASRDSTASCISTDPSAGSPELRKRQLLRRVSQRVHRGPESETTSKRATNRSGTCYLAQQCRPCGLHTASVGRQHQVQRHWYLEKVEIVGRRIDPNDSDEVLKVSLPFFSGQEKIFTHAFSSFYTTYLIPSFVSMLPPCA